jgi:opacity protein-like surface antigen
MRCSIARLLSLVTTVATAALALVAIAPAAAHAQIRVGPALGYEFDLDEDWLYFGADARIGLRDRPWEINPRVLYNSADGFSVLQLDANLLYNLALKNTTRVAPYAGVGLVMQRSSFDGGGTTGESESETKVGLNLIAGARLNTTGSVSPFASYSYSVVREQGNLALLTFGVHIAVKK